MRHAAPARIIADLMSTYDYICSNCGKTTEVVHSINSSGPSACPACGAQGTLTKAFNPPTIHFKGSGWAKKDRRPGRPKPAKSTESTESSPASGTGQEGARSSDSGGGSGDGSDSGSAAEAKAGPVPEKAATPAASPASGAD
jgi:putative FmdB family regulatory protein